VHVVNDGLHAVREVISFRCKITRRVARARPAVVKVKVAVARRVEARRDERVRRRADAEVVAVVKDGRARAGAERDPG
jgi:hypothetical protein